MNGRLKGERDRCSVNAELALHQRIQLMIGNGHEADVVVAVCSLSGVTVPGALTLDDPREDDKNKTSRHPQRDNSRAAIPYERSSRKRKKKKKKRERRMRKVFSPVPVQSHGFGSRPEPSVRSLIVQKPGASEPSVSQAGLEGLDAYGVNEGEAEWCSGSG
ncbi:hypothetical protein EYF80_042560 [Liparis tanakae]|uniref:Uncharacterized protein n=1 Tax=Liparis tanakae TaxID=230148 RepID=A0A4Z2G3Y1_9TELE|nr:hypothetical protein EYF80_042560 [Liparis tanakae]